jgi:VanZ family protein
LTYQSKIPLFAKWVLPIAVLTTVLFGLSDEFHQSFVPNRVADVLDFAADSLGAFLFWGYETVRARLSGSRAKVI